MKYVQLNKSLKMNYHMCFNVANVTKHVVGQDHHTLAKCPLLYRWQSKKIEQKVGYLLSPPTRQFFGDFGSFVSHVIICAFWWGIYCPLQLAPPTRQFFGDFWKFCFARNFLCPLFSGYLLSPRTGPSNSAIFGDLRKFSCFTRNYLLEATR